MKSNILETEKEVFFFLEYMNYGEFCLPEVVMTSDYNDRTL